MKHAFPVALTVVIVITLAALFVAVWYDGFKEGWRQANEASVPAAGGGYTPPRALRIQQL
jgi:flagellar basal body-associated protein FliL